MEASALRAPAGLSRISVAAPLLRLRTDDQLVALFRMGNEDAFRVIYDRYRQRMFAYTRQMLAGSRSDAEDALQDVFLRAYSALRADGRPVTLRAWLYRVAHNRCVDQLRRPVPAPTDLFDVSRAPLHDPMLETERREDLRRLVADVRRLPEQQRSALLMREMEGLSYAELADALNVSMPAVKSLLVRARIGLVEASEARDTACPEIRTDLATAHDRGVRVSGMARRHLRECDGCRDYRTRLRGVQQGLGALSPSSSPLAALAKLLGIGGAGTGAAAGGGAVVGGGAAAATATKVAAIACCAAVVGGGAAEVRRQMTPEAPARGQTALVAPSAPAGGVERSRSADARVLDLRTAARASATSGSGAVVRASAPVAAPVAGGVDNFVDDSRGEAGAGSDAESTATTKADPAATGGMVAPDEEAEGHGAASPAAGTGTDAPADDATATVLLGESGSPAGDHTTATPASGSGDSSSSSTSSSSAAGSGTTTASPGAKPAGSTEASSSGAGSTAPS